MASSDEEGEFIPNSVTDYHLVDNEEKLISLSFLPIQWDENESLEGSSSELQIFLRGKADNGLQSFYQEVIAWRFNLLNIHAEIYALSKDKVWIKLHNPRKSYQNTIKTLLVAINCLHFIKNYPTESGEALWNQMQKKFSTFEVLPHETDLLEHMTLVKKAAEMDLLIANNEYVATLLENSRKRKTILEQNNSPKRSKFIVEDNDEDDDDDVNEIEYKQNNSPKRSKFIVNDDDDDEDDEEDDDDVNEIELNGYVCSICDEGGNLLCCEGRCIRSFHPTLEDGQGSVCETLGYTREQVEAIKNFICGNCKYKRHQCYACGILGSSDKSSGPEVFPCISANCEHFYHPKCVAKLLHPCNKIQEEEIEKEIASGQSFLCPVHKCYKCNLGENKNIYELQFAICRRCPKAYHRKCLPREIAFEKCAEKGTHQRAWNGLLPNRILIYCMDHKIIPEIETPRRDHLSFLDNNGSSIRKSKVHGTLTKKFVFKVKRSSQAQTIHGDLKDGAKALSNLVMNKVNPIHKTDTKDLPNLTIKKQDNHNTKFNRAEMEKRILALMKEASDSVNEEELKNRYYGKHKKKKLAMEKVERSVNAARAALKKLDEGCSVEEAKIVCEPETLNQIMIWQKKLKVYLAPFLHGMRYTSFGRHFTKLDKLKEVVNRLRWYVEDGDTIVDFCCGANDFSWLMKEELENMGRNCSFKNYDLIQPKNDFNFEKRDWMSVNVEELPAGSNLIMGLNPPFGIQASLANKFINKALSFKPKLIILIVPKETQRLDKKKYPYDLIWEDGALLSGKSFYLPGSIDINEQQLDQHNNDPPPLSLWSHSQWASKHRAIAQQHGHSISNSMAQQAQDHGMGLSNYLMEEEEQNCYAHFSNMDLTKTPPPRFL